MNRILGACCWTCLLCAGALGAVACYLWDSPPPGAAWTLDHPEQVLAAATPGQEIQVPFRLKNTSRQPLRLVGGYVC